MLEWEAAESQLFSIWIYILEGSNLGKRQRKEVDPQDPGGIWKEIAAHREREETVYNTE